MAEPYPIEESLDPEDWPAFRRLAHRMLDESLDELETIREAPAWRAMPEAVRSSFEEELPWEGLGAEEVYRQYRERVRPYTNGNRHPAFYGWAQSNGTPLGAMAAFLAAALNPHMAGFNQAPARVEEQVVSWLAELMGFSRAASSGVLVTGGTMANILGLAVARHVKAGVPVRERGLAGGPQLMVYGSSATHVWAQKGVELLGIGRDGLRLIVTDDDDRISLTELERAIAEDRAQGRRPICVIGSAGTVNIGAIDDLPGLAALCRREGLWLHIDGAFGALLKLTKTLRGRVSGLEVADSVGFDLHKWGYLPFEIACVLCRDGAAQRAAFAASSPYIAETSRGVIAGGLPLADLGVDLTRGFKALKAWMAFKAEGLSKIGRLIEQNVAQAAFLAGLIDAHPELERRAPAPLNVVCFRYRGAAPEEALDGINRELLLRLQERGLAVPSSTLRGGAVALRVCLVNHRTRRSDLEALVAAAASIGGEVASDSALQ